MAPKLDNRPRPVTENSFESPDYAKTPYTPASLKENSVNIISFCLFGDSPTYTCGALENARLAKELYPDWKSVFYLGQSVAKSVSQNLEELGEPIKQLIK